MPHPRGAAGGPFGRRADTGYPGGQTAPNDGAAHEVNGHEAYHGTPASDGALGATLPGICAAHPHLRRVLLRAGPAPGLRPADRAPAGEPGQGGAAWPQEAGGRALPEERDHLLRVLGRPGHRAHLPVRPDPPRHSAQRLEPRRTRLEAAHRGAQRLSRGCLRQGAHSQGSRGAARPGGRLAGLPAQAAGRDAAPWRVRARRGDRPDPRRGRQLLRAGRQRAGPLRRFLRAGKPDGDEEGAAPRVRAQPGAARGGLPTAPAACLERGGSRRGARAADRGAHAGSVQLGLLRARLSRAADGL